MMLSLHKEQGAQLRIQILAETKVQSFISAHADTLNAAFRQVPMSDIMRQRLEKSDYVFSGMKTFHELNEAFPSLLDENGNRKPFEQFFDDVRSIDKTYNQNYLRAEYRFVDASASMAARWESFQKDPDDYLLQYRTAGDDHVRPEHAALDGITLPMSDPFWNLYYPPNDWGCRCTVVQVRRDKYPPSDSQDAIRRGQQATAGDHRAFFRFNPGIQQKAVPDYNPYTISRCRDCDIAHGADPTSGKTSLAFVPDSELCAACKLIRHAQQMRSSQKLSASEFRLATHKAINWANTHLDKVTINGQQSLRTLISTADNQSIAVGKKFFTETATKAKRDPDVVHLLKTATEFKQWIPNAKFVRYENGIHHPCRFSVYQAQHHSQNIEFKCKVLTEGQLLYTMKLI